jgi:hypothetical protein
MKRIPAARRATNMTFCAPIRSESLPNLGAAMRLASPDAENTIPANRATCDVLPVSCVIYTVMIGSTEYKATVSTKKVTNKLIVKLFSGTFRHTSLRPSTTLSSLVNDSFTNKAVVIKAIIISPPVIKNEFWSPQFTPMKPPIVGPIKEPAMLAVESVPRA